MAFGDDPTTNPAPSSARPARSPGRLAIAVGAFAIFVVMWAGFAYALLVDPGILDRAWDWLSSLPAPVAVVVWVLILPIAIGLWIWQSSWSPLVGALLAIGMVGWTFVAIDGLRRALRGS
jgi:hypothetical protein